MANATQSTQNATGHTCDASNRLYWSAFACFCPLSEKIKGDEKTNPDAEKYRSHYLGQAEVPKSMAAVCHSLLPRNMVRYSPYCITVACPTLYEKTAAPQPHLKKAEHTQHPSICNEADYPRPGRLMALYRGKTRYSPDACFFAYGLCPRLNLVQQSFHVHSKYLSVSHDPVAITHG